MRRPRGDERRDVCGGQPREQRKRRPSFRVIAGSSNRATGRHSWPSLTKGPCRRRGADPSTRQGALGPRGPLRHLIVDRDPLYTAQFESVLAAASRRLVRLPPRSRGSVALTVSRLSAASIAFSRRRGGSPSKRRGGAAWRSVAAARANSDGISVPRPSSTRSSGAARGDRACGHRDPPPQGTRSTSTSRDVDSRATCQTVEGSTEPLNGEVLRRSREVVTGAR